MIKISDVSQVWTACCQSPAYPDHETVIVRGDDPRQFTNCLGCHLDDDLDREKARLGDEMRGTNLANQLMLDLRAPAVRELGRQFLDFYGGLRDGEIGLRSPILHALSTTPAGVQEARLLQLAIRCPASTYEDEGVFEQLSERRLMPWTALRLRFPHRVLSAPTYLPGRDGPIITRFQLTPRSA